MTRYGTSYFVSRAAAERYYCDYEEHGGNVRETVARKLEAGEIHIGVPHLKAGEQLVIIDDGTRYAIEDAS